MEVTKISESPSLSKKCRYLLEDFDRFGIDISSLGKSVRENEGIQRRKKEGSLPVILGR